MSNVARWFVSQGWWPSVRAVSAAADIERGAADSWARCALIGVGETRAHPRPRADHTALKLKTPATPPETEFLTVDAVEVAVAIEGQAFEKAVPRPAGAGPGELHLQPFRAHAGLPQCLRQEGEDLGLDEAGRGGAGRGGGSMRLPAAAYLKPRSWSGSQSARAGNSKTRPSAMNCRPMNGITPRYMS